MVPGLYGIIIGHADTRERNLVIYVRSGRRSGSWNMALDQYLLEQVAAGSYAFVLRTYGWAPPCVSFGRFQDPVKEVVPEKLLAAGIDIVRRPTGGRAVWHESEITYSVIARSGHSLVSGSIDESLRKVAFPLVRALEAIGVTAGMNPSDRHMPGFRISANPCFTSHGRSEIMTPEGKKLVGSAQARTMGVFLEHGSMLLRNDQPRLADFLPEGIEPRRIELIRRHLSQGAGAILEIVPGLDPIDLEDAVVDSFAAVTGEKADWVAPENFDSERLSELIREKEKIATLFR